MSLLKRTTYQPQQVETIAEPKEGFAMVDFRDIDTVIENLTAAEMKLWLYLQKLDPFGDRWKDLPTPQEFAIRLGMSRRTVEKAAARLDELNLYTFRIKSWQGANSSGARAQQTAKKMKAAKKEREASEPLQDGRGYLAADAVNLPDDGYLAADAVNLPKKRLNNRDRDPEPLPNKDSGSPHTSSDYSNFLQTLSEGEKEKFLEFAEKEANRLPNPPVLIEKFVAAHFTELYKRFVASKDGREAKKEVLAQEDWKAHPQYEEWLHKAYYEGYVWIQANEAEREQRQKFYMWCHYTDAFAIFEDG